VDSSRLVVKGAFSDSLFLVAQVCPESSVVLDAGNDGANDSCGIMAKRLLNLKVSEPGTYYTSIFDGCEPAWLTWEVLPAPGVVLEQTAPYRIHQGEEGS
jgi:hypothetical protein